MCVAPKLELISAEYENFDVLSFSESWLNDNHSDNSIKLSNYQAPFRHDRGPDKVGGGVVVFVKEYIHATRRHDLETNDLECVWLQLKINSN